MSRPASPGAASPTVLGRIGRLSGALDAARPVQDVSGLPAPVRAPSLAARPRELLGVLQLARLAAAVPRLAAAPRAAGPGHVVLDLPGWKAPEHAAAPLRAYLRGLGHDARPWGLGVNRGDPESDTERLLVRVQELAGHGPVSLVAWSLGGVVAREVARRRPDCVARLITYGTPIVGGPTYTVGAGAYGPQECARITALTERLDRTDPIRVPVTVLFTRRDSVVAWESCLDRSSLDVEHVEVGSTHVGLGLDPDVWCVVADRLARVRAPG